MGEVISMLKKVAVFDLLIGVLGTAFIQVVFNEYAPAFFIGLALASLSFFISGLLTGNILINDKTKNTSIIAFINFIKVFIICIIGVLLFNNNINNVISYIMGFTSHLIAIVSYGVFNLYKERK